MTSLEGRDGAREHKKSCDLPVHSWEIDDFARGCGGMPGGLGWAVIFGILIVGWIVRCWIV